MRFRPASLLPLLLLLTACEPSLQSGPRVEFVGSSRFNPSNRRLTTVGDTIAVKVYAEAENDEAPLTRLVIRADYLPAAYPITYPSTYNEADDAPKSSLVYLDTLLANPGQFAFQSVQPARTTAGRETWEYTFTDAQGNSGRRSLLLRLARPDSAAEYHSYTVPLQAPGAFGRRSFLALREGLTLPSFSLRRLPENQQLADLVYVPPTTATAAPALATTTDAALKLPWLGRATQIRPTNLNAATFANYTTTEQLRTIYTQNAGQPFTPVTRTGPLTKGQVIAFRTPDEKYGLLLINDIITIGIRSLVVQVRVTK